MPVKIQSVVGKDSKKPTHTLRQNGDEETTAIPFPVNALPPVMQREVERVKARFKISAALPSLTAIGTISASLGKGLRAVHKGAENYGNLYLIGGVDTGTAKSLVLNQVASPMFDLDKELRDQWRTGRKGEIIVESEKLEDRKKYLKRQRGKKVEKGTELMEDASLDGELMEIEGQIAALDSECGPELFHQDDSIPHLKHFLAGQGEQGAIIDADGAEIFQNIMGRNNKQGNPDDAFFNKAWSGDPVKQGRVHSGNVSLDNPVLSMCVLTQPAKLYGLLKEAVLNEGGFLPRTLFCELELPTANVFANAATDNVAEWERLIRELVKQFRLCQEEDRVAIKFNEAAGEELEMYCKQRIDDADHGDRPDLRNFRVRWGENAFRLAIVLHAARHGEDSGKCDIAEEDMKAAISVAEWFRAQQECLLDIEKAEQRQEMKQRVAEKVGLVMSNNNQNPVTCRDIQRAIGNGIKSRETKMYLDELVTESRLVWETIHNNKNVPMDVYRPTEKCQ